MSQSLNCQNQNSINLAQKQENEKRNSPKKGRKLGLSSEDIENYEFCESFKNKVRLVEQNSKQIQYNLFSKKENDQKSISKNNTNQSQTYIGASHNILKLTQKTRHHFEKLQQQKQQDFSDCEIELSDEMKDLEKYIQKRSERKRTQKEMLKLIQEDQMEKRRRAEAERARQERLRLEAIARAEEAERQRLKKIQDEENARQAKLEAERLEKQKQEALRIQKLEDEKKAKQAAEQAKEKAEEAAASAAANAAAQARAQAPPPQAAPVAPGALFAPIIDQSSQFLVPNTHFQQHNQKLRSEFIKYEAWINQKDATNKSNASRLQEQSKDILKAEHGANDNYFSFAKFLNLRIGQFKQQRDGVDLNQVFHNYSLMVGEIITAFNKPQFTKEHFKMVVFELVVEHFTMSRLLKQPKTEMWQLTVDLHAEYIQRMHFTYPSLNLKEIVCGLCMSKNILFVPQLPSGESEIATMRQMDVRLDSQGKREDYTRTSERLGKWANVLFIQFRCNAYIGRGWHYLIMYINMVPRQQTSQLLFQLLTILGDRLLLAYGNAFGRVLNDIKTIWAPKYQAYIDLTNPNGVITEIQNKLEYIVSEKDGEKQTKDNTGVKVVETFLRRVLEECDELLKHKNDPSYTRKTTDGANFDARGKGRWAGNFY